MWRRKDDYMTPEDFRSWCVNCLLHHDDHAGEKCLYSPTFFAPIEDIRPGQIVPQRYRIVLTEFRKRLIQQRRHARKRPKKAS